MTTSDADDEVPTPITAARGRDRSSRAPDTRPRGPIAQRTLVLAAANGDDAAFSELVARWSGRLVAIAYRIERDWQLANDVAQDTLVTAWRDLRGLRDPDRFDAWLQRILVRRLQRAAVDSRRRRAIVAREVPSVAPDPASVVADHDALERAFRRLTGQQRAVLVLRHFQECSMSEIAAILAIPEGTVASRLHYATAAMRASLEADARPGARP